MSWVRIPDVNPTSPRPIWLGQLLHMETVIGSSPMGMTISDSDWRSWLARLLDMEKVIGSNPISETTLHHVLFDV